MVLRNVGSRSPDLNENLQTRAAAPIRCFKTKPPSIRPRLNNLFLFRGHNDVTATGYFSVRLIVPVHTITSHGGNGGVNPLNCALRSRLDSDELQGVPDTTRTFQSNVTCPCRESHPHFQVVPPTAKTLNSLLCPDANQRDEEGKTFYVEHLHVLNVQ